MFPPTPRYPRRIDNDYTLFLVHNTTESRLCKDNAAWAIEIEIMPVDAGADEIWPDNGFANIEGELLYYDAVAKNSDGKVYKLRRCARNLGGEPTKFNPKGTWIRAFVVAEHHNQLVDAAIKTEDFIGFNFDPRQKTLDWRIRNLQSLPVIFDDFNCPDCNFTFEVVSDDPVAGKLARFLVEVSSSSNFDSYRLDFGDGSFTTTDFQGTHQYAVNAVVDPVVTLSNFKCQIIQTPIERNEVTEPPAQIEAAFDFPLPEFPAVPDFTFVPCAIPEPDITLPPLVVPCISIEGQIGPIPSIIEGPSFVSQIVITGPDNPINILHSTIEIIGGPIVIPPVVLIDPPVPPTIIIDPPIPPTIVIVPPQSSIVLALDITDLPRLEVDWGTPPDMEIALTLAKPVRTPARFAADPSLVNEFGNEFADLFEASTMMKVEYESVGIPSEIRIIPPDMPKIEVDVSRPIKVDASEVHIPDIKIHGPDSPIPNVIRLNADEVPDEVPLVYRGDPIPVKIETEVVVRLETKDVIPERIVVDIPTPIPERIIVESNLPNSIVLVGPTSIPLEIPENFGIPLLLPEKMPEIELVYRGSPIEVKVTMDQIMSKNDDNTPCVMLVPCNR